MTTGIVQPAPSIEIDKCTAQLAVAFQRQIDAATVKVYRETLSDLPLWAIEAAALKLRRKGGSFFPTAPEWHQMAEVVMAERRRELLLSKGVSIEPECSECRDTGWADAERDGRTFVIPCSCRPHNTNYQRSTAASRKSQGEEVKS